MVPEAYSFRRSVVIITVTVLVCALVGWQLVTWARPFLATRYTERGIAYVKAQQFSQARAEFERAESFGDSSAHAWKEKASQAPTDPRILTTEWTAWGITAVTEKLHQATQPFATPKQALTAGVALYDAGEFAYARYPLEQAVTLDSEFPEAWHYLGLTYDSLAALDSSYTAKAQEARVKRDALTSRYLKP